MSRTTKIEQYPTRYQDILEDVSAGGVVEVTCDSEQDARRLRGHWFSFLSVVSKHKRLADLRADRDKQHVPTDDEIRVRKYDRLRGMVQCVQDGSTVRWQSYDRSWAAQQLERAQFTVAPSPAEPIAGSLMHEEIAASEQRMRDLLKEKG
jgi:hypothetical protein